MRGGVDEADVEAVLECYRSTWLTMGPRTQAFEADLAARHGVEHAVAVASDFAALRLTLLGVGIGAGDEVLVGALGSVVAAGAVRACGATPVPCDVAPGALAPGADELRGALTPRTRAAVAGHVLGVATPLRDVEAVCAEAGVALLEDVEGAIGATDADGRVAGTVGRAGCLSLSWGTPVGVGEGGVVLTDDEAVAAKVRSLRSHAMTSVTWDRHRGHAETYDVVDLGFNDRLDEPRAALGRSRLARLDDDLAAARERAVALRRAAVTGDGVEVVHDEATLERSSPVAVGVLLADRAARDRAFARLAADGRAPAVLPALTTLGAYAAPGTCPRAEALAERLLAVPLDADASALADAPLAPRDPSGSGR